MLNFNPLKINCTGCTACVSICPVQCIGMKKDNEGFLYPEVINDKCIHCKLCEKVCPMIHEDEWKIPQNKSLQISFCGIIKDKEIWRNSSSGGAFYGICKVYGGEKSIIYGAAWDGLSVKHLKVSGLSNIRPLQKSKYIESDLGEAFKDVKREIKNGKPIIFCGTPCQVSGLRRYIGNEVPNLLLIDLICHGVGSPYVFAACIDCISEQFNKHVSKYQFRSKRAIFESPYLNKVTFSDNSQEYLFNDPYMQLFFKQDCLRPSCGGNCKYRTLFRPGDITIADFKNSEKIFPQFVGSQKNYSTIVINTSKGEELICRLQEQLNLIPCDISLIKEYNPLFCSHTVSSSSRESFFTSFVAHPNKTIRDATHSAEIQKLNIVRLFSSFIPHSLRRIIINLVVDKRDGEKQQHY